MKAPETGGNLHAHEIQADQHQRKFKHLVREKKIPGLILWEIDFEKLTICRAVLESKAVTKVGKNGLAISSVNYVVKIREGCQYVQALNVKNAVRKWQRFNNLSLDLLEVKS